MKFVFLVRVDERKLQAMTASELQVLDNRSLLNDGVLRDQGKLIAAQALAPARDGATVRLRSGMAIVTDGPFAETHEVVGGFLLIEARDLAEALDLATHLPAIHLGAIEVRPVRELELKEPDAGSIRSK